MLKRHRYLLAIVSIAIAASAFLPFGTLVIPVRGATTADWNHTTFWFKPWGKSGVHKGIDIFARKGKPVLAASPGIVLYTGTLSQGGNVVAVLGPQWRVHYYAHLADISVGSGSIVSKGTPIGGVGSTGNAVGKAPHLHYSIFTLVPYVWRYRPVGQGFWRMWYLNPDKKLRMR